MNIDEVKIYVLVFFIYAFAGWIMETISISIRNKKFVNRGFLIGPVCPIYGYGVVLVSLLLQYNSNIFYVYNNLWFSRIFYKLFYGNNI